MTESLEGVAASEGIAMGPAHVLSWGVPEVPHRLVEREEVERERERFDDARRWVRARIGELKRSTAERLGPMEARIFDPQLFMLDDPAIVDGTVRYIEENRLTAARAFQWRILELQAMWTRTAHPMVLDKLSDLEDLQIRLLHRLLGHEHPIDLSGLDREVIVVARDLTPSLTVQFDVESVLGIATDEGTRQSHWVILARSLGIPAVAGLGAVTRTVEPGDEVIVDGRSGRVVVQPDARDRRVFEQRRSQIQGWKAELPAVAALESVTADGEPVDLRANLELPSEARAAREHGAEGVGLFRTEFLVVGRNSLPGEEEQFEAYRQVAEAFPDRPVTIRTFDLGGDKFPMFLHMPKEENPFLGWRAIRVCLDSPDLFRPQLRAILRATPFGRIRVMLPLVNEVDEVRRVRELLAEEEESLRAEGHDIGAYEFGILVETPGAALHAAELARHCDFFSVGTNDLVQYTLAVDRTNRRLARLYHPFHPSVVRQLHQVARVARAADLELAVCGELAATPLGAFLLLGLGITTLSVTWPSLPEMKEIVRSVRIADARVAARKALAAGSPEEVEACLSHAIGDALELELYSARWEAVADDRDGRSPPFPK